MMPFAAAAAAWLNARTPPDMRKRLGAHDGAAVAMEAGGMRLCFRLEGGYWHAASPLITADAAARWTPEDGWRISGGGALLKDLNEMWERNAPRTLLAEMFGERTAAAMADAAAGFDAGEFAAQCGIAAAPGEVGAFCRDVADLERRTARLNARLARLEKPHG